MMSERIDNKNNVYSDNNINNNKIYIIRNNDSTNNNNNDNNRVAPTVNATLKLERVFPLAEDPLDNFGDKCRYFVVYFTGATD